MRLRFVICFIFIASKVMAAGPITHAYLAQKWLKAREHLTQQEEDSFIRGTLFPDIRYLGVTTRKATHDRGITLESVLHDPSPFYRGKKLHSFIDEKREKLVIKLKTYEQLKNIPGQQYRSTFLKLLEDEILYQKRGWESIRYTFKVEHALNFIYDAELAYNIKIGYLFKAKKSFADVAYRSVSINKVEREEWEVNPQLCAIVMTIIIPVIFLTGIMVWLITKSFLTS